MDHNDLDDMLEDVAFGVNKDKKGESGNITLMDLQKTIDNK